MNKNVLVLVLFSSAVAFGNQCSERCQRNPSEPIDICFTEKDITSAIPALRVVYDLMKPMAIRRNCGYFSNIYPVASSDEIESILGELQENCQTIGKITFSGHGRPGVMKLGLSIGSVSSWSDYSCLLAPDAEMHLLGCNVGRGCLGNNLLGWLVRKFLSAPHSVGFVQAPEFGATTFLPGIIPHHPLNFTYRRVYKPSGENSALQWGSVGLGSPLFGTKSSPEALCKSDIEQTLASIDRQLVENTKNRCGITQITPPRINELNRRCFEEQDLTAFARTWASLKRKIKAAVLGGNVSLRVLSDCSQFLLFRLSEVERSCDPPEESAESESSGVIQ